MSLIGATTLIQGMSDQLSAMVARHQDGGDSVTLTINANIVVTGLQEYSIAQSDPELGYQRQNKSCMVRFPILELDGKQYGVDFQDGDICYINNPVVQPNYINQVQDQTRWEMLYFRVSGDGLMATVGLKSND